MPEITITVSSEDALAVVLGPLETAVAKMEGRIEKAGSPMAVRVALRDALAAAGVYPVPVEGLGGLS